MIGDFRLSRDLDFAGVRLLESKNTHTNEIVDLGSFRIHLTAVLSRQTRSRSDHVKLHAANCGDEIFTTRACVGGYPLISGR